MSAAKRASTPNPFPAAAVARLTGLSGDLVTIPTDAVRRASAYADDYLAGTGKAAATGNVVAVVGEYGTGKTHLALELLRHISKAGGSTVRHLYLDAPADTFLALYQQRFVADLTKEELRERVEEYYADLVADSLAQSEMTREAARRLRNREVHAEAVIERLGLMESAFVPRLRERLQAITENDAFATALTLFLRPEFEDAVWEWLRGHGPDAALAERGITEAIDNDTAALEAIGVVAFLYGRQSRRFVLVIDELEKVLSSPQPPGADAVRAFKKLLEVFGAARAFLVLSGLPDFLEALPEDARQRIGCIVRPSALTPGQTREYILDRQEGAGHPRELAPFTSTTVDFLVKLAGGNARTIVKLCFHTYRAARSAGTDVTEAMIREAAREQFQLATRDDVRAEIARVLDLGGWLFVAESRLKDTKVRADFWVLHGEDDGGCAVLIADSVLGTKEASALAKQAEALKAGRADRAVLLVVNGYLAETAMPVLTGAGDRPPLVHSQRRFTEDFDAAIKGVMQRLETAGRENDLRILRERVERQGRQQAQVLSALESLGSDRDALRGAVVDLGQEQRESTAALTRTLQEVVRLTARAAEPGTSSVRTDNGYTMGLREPTIHGDVHLHFPGTNEVSPGLPGSSTPGRPASALPEEVERIFTEALDLLEELDPIGEMVGSFFGDPRDPSTRRVSADFTPDFLRAIGAWRTLREIVERLRVTVDAWFRSDRGHEEILRAYCRAYDEIFHGLSPRTLQELMTKFAKTRSNRMPVHPDDEFVVFSQLGLRVFDALTAPRR